MLEVKALRTEIFRSDEDLNGFLAKNLTGRFFEGQILAVTSKIVSLAEQRMVDKQSTDKTTLVKREAERYIGETRFGCHMALRHGQLMASAGIDESNSENGDYLLLPEDPYASAEKIYNFLRKHFGLKNFGILITDSRTLPLRRGVIGTSLAHYGFKGIKDLVGKNDLFGRKMQMTQINIADALAASACLEMGEGGEGRPLAVLNAEVEFCDDTNRHELQISWEEDLYSTLW